MWYFVKGLRPLGWFGFFVALLGSEVLTVFARKSNWGWAHGQRLRLQPPWRQHARGIAGLQSTSRSTGDSLVRDSGM